MIRTIYRKFSPNQTRGLFLCAHVVEQISPMLLFLLMLVLGNVKLWGQTGTNYSGIFYFVNCGSGKTSPDDPKIAKITDVANYFYLVPADNPPQNIKRAAYYSDGDNNGNPETPYLTTYRTNKDAATVPDGVTNRPHNSVWIVEFASTDSGTDYYHLIHPSTGKYVVFEPPYSDKPNRKSVHLLATDSPGENAEFAITLNSGNYNFRPKGIDTGNRFFNISYGNYNSYYSTDNTNPDGSVNYHRGLVGLWSAAGDASDWKKETVAFTELPTISAVNELTNTVTVTGPAWLPAGYNIRYTFSADGVPADPTATSAIMTDAEYFVTAAGTLKVVVERYGVLLSAVASKNVEPARCKIPVFTYSPETQKVSITSGTPNTNIYYTLDETDPTTSSTRIEYVEQPFDIADQQTVKAFATRSGFRDSETASSKLVLNLTVTLAEDEYTYTGSAVEPVVSSVKDGETVISPAEYTVGYEDNVNVGDATVLINSSAGGSYIVCASTTFTIIPKKVTITANDASKTYDGTALTEDGFTTTALESGDTHTFTIAMTEGSTITNTGTQPNVIETVDGVAVTIGTETAVGNYLVTTVDGTLTVNPKSIGNGTIAAGFSFSIDKNNNVIVTHDDIGKTLEMSTDYTVGESVSGRYSTKTVSGSGNYGGNFVFKIAVAHFATDANQAEWSATFVAEKSDVADIGHVLPGDIAAYIISDIEEEWAIPEPLNYIPAGVPVLLVAHEEKSGFLVTAANSGDVAAITPEQIAYNKLKEVTAESVHFKTKQIYVLYKNEFVLNKEDDLGKGKVYMENPNYNASSAPAFLRIAWGNLTGIEDVRCKMDDGRGERWYTLDGRCLSGKPTTKGLYIVGGKKVVIK